ncbi:hypothetical protein FGG08_004395 [Glutinoglossum americanum]|uniref:Uncharacterized protein n=1 Tax=Glutinoglossum americanum TaxID=1670608 RepID=A0A9P8I9B1_9PEZI|nr:hypothetical protein FGG08_004395 [Glutinoglossum americanum]
MVRPDWVAFCLGQVAFLQPVVFGPIYFNHSLKSLLYEMSHVPEGPAKPGRKRLAPKTETAVATKAAIPTTEPDPSSQTFNGVTIFIDCGMMGTLKRKACTDTGADANFVDYEVVRRTGLEVQKITDGICFQVGDGRKLTPVAELEMDFTVGGRPHKTYSERFLVVEDAPYDAILGNEFCGKYIYTKDPTIWPHFLQWSKASKLKSEEMQAERGSMDREDMNNEQRYLQDTSNRERERLANAPSEVPGTIAEQGYPQARSQVAGYAEPSEAAQSTPGASDWEWDHEQQRHRRYDYRLQKWIWN